MSSSQFLAIISSCKYKKEDFPPRFSISSRLHFEQVHHEFLVSLFLLQNILFNFLFSHSFLSAIGIIAVFSTCVEAAPATADGKTNCFIRRLKSKGKLDADFAEYDVDMHGIDCENVIKIVSKEIYEQIALSLRKKALFNKFTPCIMADLRSQDWVDDMISLVVYELDTTIAESVKVKRTEEINEKVTKSAEDATLACLFEKEFGEMYDSFKDDDQDDTEKDFIVEYCTRKYVVAKHLLDPSYKIVMNPKNVNVEGVNCDSLLIDEFKELETAMVTKLDDDDLELTDLQKKCTLKKFRDGNFSDKFIASALTTELDLSDQQKAVEKKKFVKLMVDVITSLDVCDH